MLGRLRTLVRSKADKPLDPALERLGPAGTSCPRESTTSPVVSVGVAVHADAVVRAERAAPRRAHQHVDTEMPGRRPKTCLTPWAGMLIVVSHDRYLLERVTDYSTRLD